MMAMTMMMTTMRRMPMPLTMMLDGEVRTRVSESLAESQLRASQSPPNPPSPSPRTKATKDSIDHSN